MIDQNMINLLKKNYHLHPGEIFVTGDDMNITTVLGSCVAVCIWDSKRGIAGMNHIMLPVTRDDEPYSTRYGNVATFVLYDMLRSEGCFPKFMRVMVFGGANAMAKFGTSGGVNVGQRNIDVTLKVLQKLKLDIIKKDLGGQRGRKIVFNVKTGKIDFNYLGQFDFGNEIESIIGG
ncbi:MAG: chemotaxis protein CheD [Flavobacteriaceae bacterium]|nr:chemotaxis protein CheD [Flavobacteriaceae bacterium]